MISDKKYCAIIPDNLLTQLTKRVRDVMIKIRRGTSNKSALIMTYAADQPHTHSKCR